MKLSVLLFISDKSEFSSNCKLLKVAQPYIRENLNILSCQCRKIRSLLGSTVSPNRHVENKGNYFKCYLLELTITLTTLKYKEHNNKTCPCAKFSGKNLIYMAISSKRKYFLHDFS